MSQLQVIAPDCEFLWTGMLAFVLLIPLALTSNRRTISRLGRRWQTLHRLAYVAVVPTLVHFWLRGPFAAVSVRKWIVIVILLFGLRLLFVLRKGRSNPRPMLSTMS